MPSSSHFRSFLLVFALLCVVSVTLVLLAEIGEYEWANKVVTVGQESSRLFFGAIALTFIVVEGGQIMISAWLREKEMQRAKEHAKEEERNLFLEADRRRQEGETLSEAVERLRREKKGRAD